MSNAREPVLLNFFFLICELLMVLNRAFGYEREDTRTYIFSIYFKFSQDKIELTATLTDLSKRKRDFKRVKQLPVYDRY